jgi:hypothetical protein
MCFVDCVSYCGIAFYTLFEYVSRISANITAFEILQSENAFEAVVEFFHSDFFASYAALMQNSSTSGNNAINPPSQSVNAVSNGGASAHRRHATFSASSASDFTSSTGAATPTPTLASSSTTFQIPSLPRSLSHPSKMNAMDSPESILDDVFQACGHLFELHLFHPHPSTPIPNPVLISTTFSPCILLCQPPHVLTVHHRVRCLHLGRCAPAA